METNWRQTDKYQSTRDTDVFTASGYSSVYAFFMVILQYVELYF